jgi:hypothetical protein
VTVTYKDSSDGDELKSGMTPESWFDFTTLQPVMEAGPRRGGVRHGRRPHAPACTHIAMMLFRNAADGIGSEPFRPQ